MPLRLRLRRYALFLLLSLPLVLMPQEPLMGGMNSHHFDIGWPIPAVHMRVGGGPDDSLLHFEHYELLPVVLVISMTLTGLGWRARTWAVKRPEWVAAVVQAFLTSLYCVLLFVFLYNVVGMIWVCWVWSMDMPAFHSAAIFSRRWAPYLAALGVAGVFCILYLDSRTRKGWQRIVHAGFALCFVIAICWLFRFFVWELKEMDETIKYSEEKTTMPGV